ncbi:hypothetical protein KXD93_18560 [Mucilaginibacter sp. BJC16-A38]|uniref:M949_RS01915 family surface polysaccharide biosynthesis protein n=1 Tax=Mucilaginibacter phenanthrenivorans TaxID=1234842 RepID=UPI002158517A|nr:hypothetical protein [Mucilaginibacter phenanthrenivorans]MCR8559665.1 hypothetical protein [Mucilaginibacter phenanthrenivorans]
MKLTIAVALLFISYNVTAQITIVKLDKNTLPKLIKYTGHVIDAVKFIDGDGEHLLITTETGITKSKGDEDFRSAALYAYHYKVNGSEFKLTWQTYDFVNDCPVDLEASYVPNTFAITDLNKDGKAEIWLMYRTVCHGDVSPGEMKVIMHEADKKYAMRGTSKAKISATDYMGGKYTFDPAFISGPEPFRQYAERLWKKNLME